MKKILILIFSSLLFYCGEKKDIKNIRKQNTIFPKAKIELTNLNGNKTKYQIGDSISFGIKYPDSLKIDSVKFSFAGETLLKDKEAPFEIKTKSTNFSLGQNDFSAIVYAKKQTLRASKRLLFLSDIIPEKYTYKVKNTYPHDKQAYTQGLFYHNGIFYEGTGGKGKSSLRKVKVESGEILQSYAMRGDYFGEGITLINNKIVQLTWQSNTAFVYDAEKFELKHKFSYPSEGWGITTVGNELYMSDGTAKLYVLSASSFAEIKRLQVYDNLGPVVRINELEYIEGFIYANIYETQKIAKINPKNGKVTAWIDLSGILPRKEIDIYTDVMNGIAYDKENKRIFVTGKNWSKLFEVEFIKK